MPGEPTYSSNEPPQQVLYAPVLLLIVLIAVLVLVGVYGT
jgi:hypothetical protein